MSDKPNSTDADDDFWSLPREKAIAQLMQEFDMSRERAEAILERDREYVRRDAMERLTREEYDEFLKELDSSGEEVFTFGSSSKEDKPDDEEQQDT